MSRRLRSAGRPASIAAICVIALLAFSLSDYSLFQLSRVLAIAIAVLSLNLLTGFTGQISVGHGALFGIGAYVVAVLTVKLSVSYGIAMVAAAVSCFAVGLLIGIPALRIRGLYLGLLTLGLAVILPPFLKRIPDVTGGVYGLNVVTPDAPLGLPLTPAQWIYLLGVALLAASMLVLRNLSRGRFGRACDALRTSEAMAASSGVEVGRVKVTVFAISAAMAGVGGGVYQLVLGATTPDTFALTLSLSLITASILGGIRSLWGALIGAAFVVYVPDEAATLGDSAPQFVYAGVLLAVIYLLPDGVARLPERMAAATAGMRARRPVLRTTGTNPEGGGNR